MDKKKIIHLEIIRLMALFCIVYNHIGYILFEGLEKTFEISVSVLISILCKVGVPLFFMVSGALLLGREESWADVYKKRVFRIAIVIVVFNTIRFLYECYITKVRTFSVVYLVKGILTGSILHPYWFLYAYLSVLLILPILRIIVRNLDFQGKKWLLGLIILFYMIVPLKALVVNQQWQVTLLLDEKICYMFLGYFIERELNEEHFKLKNKLLVSAGAFMAIAISFWMIVRTYIQGEGFATEHIPMLSMPLACAIFYLIKGKSLRLKNGNEKLQNWILQLGNCVFGVYLIEDYLRAALVLVCEKCNFYLGNLIVCIISTFGVIIVGISIVYILRKIPILRKLL